MPTGRCVKGRGRNLNLLGLGPELALDVKDPTFGFPGGVVASWPLLNIWPSGLEEMEAEEEADGSG